VTICFSDDCPSNLLDTLFGKNVVITGIFNYGTQYDIHRILRDAGAYKQSAVSGKTDYVVVGGRTQASRGSGGGYIYSTSKEMKAKSRNIPIISEDELMIMAGKK